MAKTKKGFKEEIKNELTGILFVAFSFYLFWINYIYIKESSVTGEGLGILGGFLIRVLSGLFGEGKILIPVILLVLGINMMYKRSNFNKNKVVIIGLLFIIILTFLHLNLPTEKQYININGLGGGLIGGLICWITLRIFGLVGSYIFLGSFFLACLLYLFKISLKDLFLKSGSFIREMLMGIKESISNFVFTTVENEEEKVTIKNNNAENKVTSDENVEQPLIINHFEQVKKVEDIQDEEKAIEISKVSSNEDFVLPDISMLEKIKKNYNSLNQKIINENINSLKSTLDSFGVKGKVIQVSCGPSITRYEFQPAPGVKVSRIVNLADDIALSLAAAGVRIEAPIPGKAAIGIEVPNPEVLTVSLREVLEADEFINSPSKLTVALGKDIAGKPVIADLTKMPHLLIAGATGSGKSVCMNSLITSILFKAKPSEVKFVMIDPKMVELTTFNGIPHLITPVVTDAKKAASALRWAVHEMENRYELFAAQGVKDIVRYNQMVKEGECEQKNSLPYIVVLIDELADLMMVAPADVEDAICRLAQMARAAGIHLVVATQRPSVDVITGIIKANIPSRIAFAVSSQTDSRTILDMNGAEKLLGRGDMLFYPTGYPKPVRVQGVYVSDKEVEAIVKFLKEQEKPEYLEEIVNQDIDVTKQKNDDEDDELIPEVAKLFIESGQASISLIQRRFRVGYTRAARIIDIMEKKGLIGGYEGSKPRQVLITIEDYERLFGKY